MKKRFLAVLLSLAMTLCLFSTSVFAEDSNNNTTEIPENATRHTIAINLQPEEEFNPNISIIPDNSVSPCIWGDPSLSMIDNYVAYTGEFYVSDRYFAYEMQGFLDGNPVTDEGYCVSLEYVGGGIIASSSGYADGTLYKHDWITIYTDGYYRFKVTNATDYILTVYLTYYSWN